jgi:hypothetical protein
MTEVFTNPKYRGATEVCIIIAMIFYFSGIPVITIVANNVFAQTTVTPAVAVQVLSVASLVGALIGPFVSNFGTIK